MAKNANFVLNCSLIGKSMGFCICKLDKKCMISHFSSDSVRHEFAFNWQSIRHQIFIASFQFWTWGTAFDLRSIWCCKQTFHNMMFCNTNFFNLGRRFTTPSNIFGTAFCKFLTHFWWDIHHFWILVWCFAAVFFTHFQCNILQLLKPILCNFPQPFYWTPLVWLSIINNTFQQQFSKTFCRIIDVIFLPNNIWKEIVKMLW